MCFIASFIRKKNILLNIRKFHIHKYLIWCTCLATHFLFSSKKSVYKSILRLLFFTACYIFTAVQTALYNSPLLLLDKQRAVNGSNYKRFLATFDMQGSTRTSFPLNEWSFSELVIKTIIWFMEIMWLLRPSVSKTRRWTVPEGPVSRFCFNCKVSKPGGPTIRDPFECVHLSSMSYN